MKNSFLIALTIVLSVTACRQDNSDLAEKKKELQEARKEYQELKAKISALETEIKKIDPESSNESSRAILVSSFVTSKNPFEHKVDVRGTVESKKNVLISAQIPGVIKNVQVKEGQKVNKGQVLVSLDADIIRSNINELKSALKLANTLYEKQSRLWEQKIGTEVQYLQAKNNKESLESKLNTAYAQLDQAVIRAPFSGTVDLVEAREGEVASPGQPLVRIVSPEDMYINAEVSERFLGKVAVGDKVDVFFPVQNKRLTSEISSVSGVLNPENRTFRVEVKLPKMDTQLKPNQVTILDITDYQKKDALTIPTRLILKDNEGEYVYGISGKNNNKVATKIRVKSGVSYDGKTEIVEGLKGGEELVDKGFRDVTEGVEVAVKADEVSQVAKY